MNSEVTSELEEMYNGRGYRVTFIIPYIGEKVPPYLNLFFNSCSYNINYQFLLFTNLNIDINIPSNVKIIRIDRNEIENLILKKTGIKANLSRFYKICDFKPVFGEIFSDYLVDSPFWGHTDLDLILGNLNKFLPPLLEKFDILSFRAEYHTGSFAIYKNNSVINSLYRRVGNYDETLENPAHLAFDEVSRFRNKNENIYNYLIDGGDIDNVPTEVESYTHLLKNKKRVWDIQIYFKTLIKEGISPGIILKINKGSILEDKLIETERRSSKEFLLYHFVLEKASLTFDYPTWKIIPDEYYITRFGFHKYKSLIPLEIIYRKIKLLFTKYPYKAINKIKNIYLKRYQVNEQAI